MTIHPIQYGTLFATADDLNRRKIIAVQQINSMTNVLQERHVRRTASVELTPGDPQKILGWGRVDATGEWYLFITAPHSKRKPLLECTRETIIGAATRLQALVDHLRDTLDAELARIS